MENETSQKSGHLRSILAIVGTLLLIGIGVLIFLFHDKLSTAAIRSALSGESSAETAEPYAYELGSEQVFARMGKQLVVASATGVQLLDEEGALLTRQIFPMSAPAVAASETLCAVFDAGGTTLRLFTPDGTVTEMDSESAILSVTVNKNGYLAVTTEESGYKGLVTVYDAAQSRLFEWYSGTGQVLSARVSPDNRRLAAVTVTGEGGRIVFFDLDSEEEQGDFLAENELFFDAAYLENGTLCVLSDTRAVMLESDGTPVGVYSYEGRYIADYSMEGDGFLALRLCKYRTGSEGWLVTVNAKGEELGTLAISEDVLGLSCESKNLALLSGETVSLFSSDLTLRGEEACEAGMKTILLLEGQEALVLSSYYAQKIKF